MTFRTATRAEIAHAWGDPPYDFIVTPYRVYRPDDVEGAWVVGGGAEVGFVTWSVAEAEVVSLDSYVESRGYGTAALEHVEGLFRTAGLPQSRLHTTNPNIRAITLYLRHRYRVVQVHLDAMERVRALKPIVPAEEFGLPLRDMWEMVKTL